ncbi:ABC transporter permease subunit [Brachybacterium sp. MASK1Z-5]|uniref:ABC transporter permease subunit n=1 Tax=Brachybacterium halotolerans TaxID=2795215 RepID=A0ABS1B822_9MICO|nr:carbohydrate ABC transporter permease [Brachybacterium halotolerans]MBK0330786.1 ABC transporter permease subunit [Brachybacterium halotolerans]
MSTATPAVGPSAAGPTGTPEPTGLTDPTDPDAPTGPSASPASGAARARRRPLSPGRIVAWIVMIVILLVTLFPFYWMLRTALSSNTALATDPTSLLPVDFSLGGFERVFGLQDVETAVSQGGSGASINFWRYLLNSVIVATVITVVQTFSCAMAAYAFSRLRWRGRETVFLIFLGAMMIPQIFTLLPNFILIKNLHLVDTLLGIMLPTLFISPFAIFFLRQFFNNISREVEEAALIDGASKPRVFFTLILPISSAPLATLALLTYMTAWNEYFWSLMVSYTDSSRVLTVALGVFRAQSPQTGTDWAGLMAATLVAAAPMLILFVLFAKRIVNSIGFSGIK